MPTGETYADWEAVYRDNVDRVYRTMFAKVGNRPDAEDLTAEVFLAALRPLRVSASVGQRSGSASTNASITRQSGCPDNFHVTRIGIWSTRCMW